MTRAVRGRSIGRFAPAILPATLLCACIQGPNYQAPAVSVPTAYRFQDGALAATSLTSTDSWWRSFGDNDLDELVRECLVSNRDLRIATARVDEFAAILQGTRSQGLPQLGYGLSASRQRASREGNVPIPQGRSAVSSSFSAVFSAGWEIDLWGRIRRETEAARASLLATEEARRGVVLTLISSVITSYVTLLDLDAQLRVAEATVVGRKESVTLYRTRLDGGFISDFEMAQVLAEYETAVAVVPDLKRAISQQEDALSVLLGRNPGPIRRASRLEGLGAVPLPAGLPSDLLIRRPDIAEAEQRLVASNAAIGAARALYFPRISLTGLGGFASAALDNLFTGSARTWSFAADIAGPIYAGGGIEAATLQADARRAQAEAAYELTIQNAFREVDDALANVRSTREVEASLVRRVEVLTRGLVLARDRYDNGYSDSLDVLDTERSLFSAQLSLVSAHADRHRALISLYRTLGGDWVPPPASRAASNDDPKGAVAPVLARAQ